MATQSVLVMPPALNSTQNLLFWVSFKFVIPGLTRNLYVGSSFPRRRESSVFAVILTPNLIRGKNLLLRLVLLGLSICILQFSIFNISYLITTTLPVSRCSPASNRIRYTPAGTFFPLSSLPSQTA